MDPIAADSLKACCAAFYEAPVLRALLGGTLHPGGRRTTAQLGRLLGLGPGDRVLDVACGPGQSARALAEDFGCRLTGLDYSARSAAEARRMLGGRARFVVGDAERLPFADARFDAVMIECSLCLVPRQEAAVAEMRRVLRPGGRIGVADLALETPLPRELSGMLGWVACIGGARPTDAYRRLLGGAGFEDVVATDVSWALSELADVAEQALRLLDTAVGLGKGPSLPVEPARLRGWLGKARAWIADGRARYVLLTGRA